MDFATPVPSEQELSQYYREMGKYQQESLEDLIRLDAAAEDIKKYMDSYSRVLDFGCAHGGLANRVGGIGVDVRDDIIGAPFDVIVISHVLEHLINPRFTIQYLRDFLAPEGILWIEVPDPSYCDGAPYQQFSTEHINYFTPSTLAKVVAMPIVELGYRGNVIRGVFQKRDRLTSYIAHCRALEAPGRIGEGKMVVWGTGTQTLRAIASGAIDIEQVEFFIDSNPNYWGKTIEGREIRPPGSPTSNPVLISSKIHKNSILQAAESMGYKVL